METEQPNDRAVLQRKDSPGGGVVVWRGVGKPCAHDVRTASCGPRQLVSAGVPVTKQICAA